MFSEEKLDKIELQAYASGISVTLYVADVIGLISTIHELKKSLNNASDMNNELLEKKDRQLRNVENWIVNDFSRKGCPSGACDSGNCSVMSCADCWRDKVRRVVRDA